MQFKRLIAAAAASAVLLAVPAHAVTLKWAAQNDVITLDPHSQNHATTHSIMQHVYEGLVRYDKDFKPARLFQKDADTLALFQFEEAKGDQLTDSSGNGHHGKIIGAKWVKVPTTPIHLPGDFALSFDTDEQLVSLPNLQLDVTGPFTIEATGLPDTGYWNNNRPDASTNQ